MRWKSPYSRPLLSLAVVLLLAIPGIAPSLLSQEPGPGDRMIQSYFKTETARLARNCLREIKSREDWEEKRDLYRRQLLEMLGLQPLPKRTPLHPTITGTADHPEFTVKNLHYRSRPGLYVTGNLYIPRQPHPEGGWPAILYVCGHGRVKKDDISYGNKTNYHHHGSWFARNGYVCLTIDTLQLGEIEGVHHGTYRHGRWWWNARGYTPAGVEAWNCMRALDYLESLPEVDQDRIGVTGRSGGGAYSWWISALDERIKVAVPVAGITSLKNHVVDGCVEGHCDCMFHVNTFRWDFAKVAALVAPRPLLIANSDKDRIFPLDGVVDVYNQTRRIYRLLGAEDKIGLAIVEGPHKDTQPIRVPAFHWFERFLKGKENTDTFEMAAVKFFEPEQLKVFKNLPDDESNTTIDETFTRTPQRFPLPTNKEFWIEQRNRWLFSLKNKAFRGWPQSPPPLAVREIASSAKDGLVATRYTFTSQDQIELPLYVVRAAGGTDPVTVDLQVIDESLAQGGLMVMLSSTFPEVFPSNHFPPLPETPEPDAGSVTLALEALKRSFSKQRAAIVKIEPRDALVFFAPRGVGPTRWTDDEKKRVHIRRRFMLLGQTLDGMRVWDIRRAIAALTDIPGAGEKKVQLMANGIMGGNALYASLFEPSVGYSMLYDLPVSHKEGPVYLNVLRYLDMPQAVALAAEQGSVMLVDADSEDWNYPLGIAHKLNWDSDRLEVIPSFD